MPGRACGCLRERRRLLLTCSVVLILLLQSVSVAVVLSRPAVAASGGPKPSMGEMMVPAIGHPDPFQITLPYGYYVWVVVSNPYQGSIQLKFSSVSNQNVDVYVMTAGQFSDFQQTGTRNAAFHSSGTNVAGTVSLSALSTYDFVVVNDLVPATANLVIALSTNPINVYAIRSTSPAPVGIADYGVENTASGVLAYEQTVSGVIGTVSISSISSLNGSLPASEATHASTLQLNVVLQVNSTKGQFAYWLQNVIQFRSDTNTLYFQSEIFNFTSLKANLSSSSLTGGGKIFATNSGSTYIFATQSVPYSLPYGVQLPIIVSQSSSGVSLKFGYDVTANGKPVAPSTNYYDTVVISEPGTITGSGIVVDGYKTNQRGLFYDNELVFCGPGNGWATTFTAMNAVVSMFYQLSDGTLVQPKSLFEFGGDTGEATYNLQTSYRNGDFSVAMGKIGFSQNYLTPGGTVVPLTLNYGVSGGSPTSKAPVLTYTYSGFTRSANLSSTPTIYFLDKGSTWAVGSPFANTQNERWAPSGSSGGQVTASQSLTLLYYHQFLVQFLCGVSGGGTPVCSPTVTYASFGAKGTVTAGSGAIWADNGTAYAYSNPLAASTSTERWYASSSQGVVGAPGSVTMQYQHQFLLSIVSPTSSSQWSDSGSTAAASTSGVYGRTGGIGYRVSSYSVDGSSPVTVGGTTGTVTVSVVMNGAHSVSFGSVMQFQLSLDDGATKAISSLTSPTISGDNYWYDMGTPVTLKVSGVWGRSAGIGTRMTGYQVNNGASAAVSTAGTITVLDAMAITSPQSVTTTSVTQYQVSLDPTAASAVASSTAPTISGDNYWYDAGSKVDLSLNGVWGRSAGSGNRLTGYSVNGGTMAKVITAATVNVLTVSTISSPQSVSATAVRQYQLSTPTGSVTSVTRPTVDGDASWYDSGTNVTLSYSGLWNVVSKQSRLVATGYALDSGGVATLPGPQGANFTVSVAMSAPHTVNVKSATQYYITFGFTNGDGSKQITPSDLQISVGGTQSDIPSFTVWLTNGTAFTVSRVAYEGSDVKPTNPTQYTVTGPVTIATRARVYDATVRAVDFLGLAVSGAQVRMTLANGTLLSGTTNGDGEFSVPSVPLGTFTAAVSNFGITTQVVGDASIQKVTPASVYFGLVSLGLIGAIAVIGVTVFLLRGRLRKKPAFPAS